MSNPPTIFRTALHVLQEHVRGSHREGRVLITTPGLNEEGAVTAAWPNGVQRTCISCDHFLEGGGEICRLVGARPPARIIAFACEKYEDDADVPF